MKRVIALLAAVALMGPAVAQSAGDPYRSEAMRPSPFPNTDAPTPKPAHSKLSGDPDDIAVQAVHNYGGCIAETTPKGAEELLALDPASPSYKSKLSALGHGHADSRCLFGRMRSNSMLLAGGMAEKLLVMHTDGARFVASVTAEAAAPPFNAHNLSEAVATCVVRADPKNSWALFGTEPATPDEANALKALAPSLPGCVRAGQKLALNRPGLRAMVALAAYHMTQPAAPAQGS